MLEVVPGIYDYEDFSVDDTVGFVVTLASFILGNALGGMQVFASFIQGGLYTV